MTTYRKTKQIILNGGFHNSRPIKVNVPIDYHPGNDRILDVVSETVGKKLMRHFCGIKSCTCGGVNRARIMDSTL